MLIARLTASGPTSATCSPRPDRASTSPLATSERTASRITVRETPNCSPRSRSDSRRSPGASAPSMIACVTLAATFSDSVAPRITCVNSPSCRSLAPLLMRVTISAGAASNVTSLWHAVG